jgi:hypothetical protein
MRRFFSVFALALICCIASFAQSKKVSILGDSYSTYKEYIPKYYDVFYPINGCDVKDVEQTWWMKYIKSNGYELEKNDSWSGSTICNTGYNKDDYSDRAFFTRVNKLGNPDIIFIFGGTNDAWANSPIGEYKYADWSKTDLYSFRPATAYMLSQLKMLYPKADVYFLLNSELKEEINESVKTVCAKYNVPVIALHDINKQIGHPSIAGMQAISDQINEFINKK